eukprot:15430728-Alexandrium_andersonii.AAC.1
MQRAFALHVALNTILNLFGGFHLNFGTPTYQRKKLQETFVRVGLPRQSSATSREGVRLPPSPSLHSGGQSVCWHVASGEDSGMSRYRLM